MIKHGPSMDLENLDFEAVEKEIEEDEVAQVSTQTTVSTGVEPSQANRDNDGAPQAWTCQSFFFFFFFESKVYPLKVFYRLFSSRTMYIHLWDLIFFFF